MLMEFKSDDYIHDDGYIHIYTDGSHKNDFIGGGYVIADPKGDNHYIDGKKEQAPKTSPSFCAEALAVYAALSTPYLQEQSKIVIYTDLAQLHKFMKSSPRKQAHVTRSLPPSVMKSVLEMISAETQKYDDVKSIKVNHNAPKTLKEAMVMTLAHNKAADLSGAYSKKKIPTQASFTPPPKDADIDSLQIVEIDYDGDDSLIDYPDPRDAAIYKPQP